MTVIYFTATGNSLYVAKNIGGNLLSIPQILKKEERKIQDDVIGLIFPVYGLCVPPYIKEFLGKVTLQSDYIFSILTYGFYEGATGKELLEIGRKNGIQFSYINEIKMVENYLPAYEMEREKKKRTKQEIDSCIEKIKQDIMEKRHWILKEGPFASFMTKCHEKWYHYHVGEGVTKDYQIADVCSGCGICTKVCPMGNIHIKSGKPVFKEQCMSCLACIQNCPKQAIHLTKEKSEVRFRNEDISLVEVIESNNTLN
ncbi:ferredoxin [Lachnospiraceae bacterium KM106-2]|nr:ferredoxin [Lachnospiraceae bacterium KM106-2]